MQNISNRLSTSDWKTLPDLVDELYYASQITVTWYSGVSLTLPNHRGSISLTSLISRLVSLYRDHRTNNQGISKYTPCHLVQKILLLYTGLEERASQKVQNASIITQIFLSIKRFFVCLWFNRVKAAQLLSYISLQMIQQGSKFHLTTINQITNGDHKEGTTGDFIRIISLPPELAEDAVVMTSLSGSTHKLEMNHKNKVTDSIELTNKSAIDILAIRPALIPALKLQNYLDQQGLAHRFTIIDLDSLRYDLDSKKLKPIPAYSPLPWPRFWQNRDYFLKSR